MPPQVVATTTADPDFYTRKAQMLGQAIESLRLRAEQRRQQKEQQEMAEIQRFFTAAEGMPELASTWGAQVKEKYGAKYPGVGEMVDAINKRAEIPAMVQAKGQEFAAKVDAAEAARAQRGQELQAMPDMIDMPVPPVFSPFGGQMLPPGMTVPVANETKQRGLQEYNSVDPQFVPFMVAQQMPFRDRAAAGIWAKKQGIQVPAPATYDPWGDDLPDAVKAQQAADLGKLTGGAAKATSVMNKLEPSPARLQEQGYQTEEREERDAFDREERIATQGFQDEARRENDRLQRERMEYQDRLSRARMDKQAAIDNAMQGRREAGRGNDDSVKGLSKDLAADSAAAQKAYDKELNQALLGLMNPSDIAAARKEFVRNHGARPTAISKIHARRIENHLRAKVAAGELAEEDIEAEAEAATASFMAATGRGIAPSDAIGIALGGEETPAVTEGSLRHRQRQRLNEIRESGDVEVPPDDQEEATEADGVALRPQPSSAAPKVDRKRVESIIRKANPNWTEAQVQGAVSAYIAEKEGG